MTQRDKKGSRCAGTGQPGAESQAAFLAIPPGADLTEDEIKKVSDLFEAVDSAEVGHFAKKIVKDPTKRPAIKREAEKLDRCGVTLSRQQWIVRIAFGLLGATGVATVVADPAIQSVINSEVGIAALAIAIVSALSSDHKS